MSAGCPDPYHRQSMEESDAEPPGQPRAQPPGSPESWGGGVLTVVLAGAACLAVVRAEWPRPNGGELLPLLLPLAATVVLFGIERLRGAGVRAAPLALSLLTAAIAGHAGAQVPAFSSIEAAGHGPLSGLLLGLAALALVALFALNPARLRDGELAVVALVVFAAGNGKVWTRENELFFPLYGTLAAVAVTIVACEGRLRLARAGRLFFGAAAAFCAWVLVCGFLGENPGRTDEVFGRMLAGCLAGVVAACALDRRGVQRGLFVTGACGLAAWAALPAIADVASALELGQVLSSTRLRLFGLHPNLTGTFLAVQLVLAVALIGSRRGGSRILLGLVLAGTAPALYLTRSRTAWVAAVVGLAALFAARKLSRRAWILVLTAGTGLFLTLILVPAGREAVFRPGSSSSSWSQRVYLWDAAARLVAEDPLTGIGVNNFFAHSRASVSPSYFDNTEKNLHPHNLFLSVAEGSGVPGVLLFGCLVVGAFAMAARASRGRDGPQRVAGRAVLATLATLFAANMFDLGLSQVTFVPTLFWILAGFAAVLASGDVPERKVSPLISRAVPVAALAFVLVFCARPFAAELAFAEGVRLEELEEPGPALAAWERTQRLLPWSAAAVVRSAKLNASSGSPGVARDLYRTATELAPTHPRYRYRYANFLALRNRVSDALREIEAALRFDPHGTEEGTLRTLRAELLARQGRGAEVEAEIARAMYVMPALPDRFRQGERWILAVAGEPSIDLARVALELSVEVAAGAGQRELWENRRLGDRIARILRQVGRGEEALAMLAAMEEAMGYRDTSLRRIETEIRAELGLLEGVEEIAEYASAVQERWADKVQLGLVDDASPREVLEKCERDRLVRMDAYFNAESFRWIHERLYKAALLVGDLDRARSALESALYFSSPEQRLDGLADWTEAMRKRGRDDEALAAIRRGIVAADAIEHSATRSQKLLRLVAGAIALTPGPDPGRRMAEIERRTRTSPRGASWRLFRILCRLNLAQEGAGDRELVGEARELQRELRARFPAEGVAIDRFLSEVR